MAVRLYTRYYPYCHFFAMHKTYGTLCKNQEEQVWCYMQKEIYLFVADLRAILGKLSYGMESCLDGLFSPNIE